jgi:L-asparaginase II
MRVEYIRDGLVEEFHDGVLSFENDNDLTPYFLRSCAKPLQASLLIDYSANFTPKELAFCSGSHAGEDCHVETAKKLLEKLKLNESYLKCGIHPPLSHSMRDKMILQGEKATVLHNNCSGKHIGFLAVCKLNGWNLDTYYEPNHPLHKEVRRKIYELCEVPLNNNYPVTTDGCGVPIVSMPLSNLVKGYKNLSKEYPQIVSAIISNPYIYGGEDRLDTEIIQNSQNIIAKVGAGGLCIVYNIEKNQGFAVKMNDASMPARRIAVLETLKNLGWADIPYDNKIKTLNGKVVGEIKVNMDVNIKQI